LCSRESYAAFKGSLVTVFLRRKRLPISARRTSDLGLPSSEKSEADPALSAAGDIALDGLVITY
jgi:hypothetical protein